MTYENDIRIELYEAGYSVKQVAEMTNYSKSAVYACLRRNDVEMRPPGWNPDIEAKRQMLQRNYIQAA